MAKYHPHHILPFFFHGTFHQCPLTLKQNKNKTKIPVCFYPLFFPQNSRQIRDRERQCSLLHLNQSGKERVTVLCSLSGYREASHGHIFSWDNLTHHTEVFSLHFSAHMGTVLQLHLLSLDYFSV